MDEERLELERQKKVQKEYKVPLGRLWSYNRPEWPYVVPGVLAAAVDGCAMPVCAIVLVKLLDSFDPNDKEKMKEQIEMLCLCFTILGVVDFLSSTVTHGCFAILGEAMTKRLRM